MNALMLLLLLRAALPPINSANDAVLQLRTGKPEAIAHVDAACRGKLRHALKDEPRLVQELLRASASAEAKRAALDAHRCLSPAKFVELLKLRLAEADPTIAAYAAEVSARVADPVVVAPLLDRLEERKTACMGELEAAEVERCVWLTYAPGASLSGADRPLRERAARLAAEMLSSPHPKVREVAVETLASARLKAHAADVAALIAKEKKGAFAKKNDAALLGRFEERRRALAKGD
jgi:hypothetical protein